MRRRWNSSSVQVHITQQQKKKRSRRATRISSLASSCTVLDGLRLSLRSSISYHSGRYSGVMNFNRVQIVCLVLYFIHSLWLHNQHAIYAASYNLMRLERVIKTGKTTLRPRLWVSRRADTGNKIGFVSVFDSPTFGSLQAGSELMGMHRKFSKRNYERAQCFLNATDEFIGMHNAF